MAISLEDRLKALSPEQREQWGEQLMEIGRTLSVISKALGQFTDTINEVTKAVYGYLDPV